jgi:hypothetical protein
MSSLTRLLLSQNPSKFPDYLARAVNLRNLGSIAVQFRLLSWRRDFQVLWDEQERHFPTVRALHLDLPRPIAELAVEMAKLDGVGFLTGLETLTLNWAQFDYVIRDDPPDWRDVINAWNVYELPLPSKLSYCLTSCKSILPFRTLLTLLKMGRYD